MRIHPPVPPDRRRPFRGFLGRWFLANTVLSGILALAWLVLRSGAKPNRITYPCQQAAVGAATLAFGVPVVAAIAAARRRIQLWLRSPAILATAAIGLALTVSLTVYLSRATELANPPAALSTPIRTPPDTYRAQLFHVADCPEDPAGNHFVGLSNLVLAMGRGGLKLYNSEMVSPVAGPDGVLRPEDVVVVKINYQWDQRGGTNTDLLRGLIRWIVNHPDGFVGEVIVCENAQFNPVNGFDRALNNAQDYSLSPHDVVVGFQGQGFNVSHYDWTSIRGIQTTEYSAGNLNDGYIVAPYDPRWQGRLSYPKFRSAAGTYVSIKYGIWDPGSGTYDRGRLKFINVPVLKSHHSTYGATVSIKHYMGVVTGQLGTNSHSAIRFGIMGGLLAEIQMADLNIVDAIWINANPYSGPATTYAEATRRDELVASLDPIAIDIWSVKNILIPGFIANGYSPPWPPPSADPDLPSGAFRTYLDNSMNHLLAAGIDVTNDYGQIDVLQGNGAGGDFDQDGDVDPDDFSQFADCFTGPDGGPVGPDCDPGDFDGDTDIDCIDWDMLLLIWTEIVPPPPLPPCEAADLPEAGSTRGAASLSRPMPNPTDAGADIVYSIAVPGPVRLAIFDSGGRLVRTLADGTKDAGAFSVHWDGRNDRGERVGPGVYWYRLEAPGHHGAKKVVVLGRP